MTTPITLVLSLSDIYDLLEAARATSKATYGVARDHSCIVLYLRGETLPEGKGKRPGEVLVSHVSLLEEVTRVMDDAEQTAISKHMTEE
jgi:hypothetical protein